MWFFSLVIPFSSRHSIHSRWSAAKTLSDSSTFHSLSPLALCCTTVTLFHHSTSPSIFLFSAQGVDHAFSHSILRHLSSVHPYFDKRQTISITDSDFGTNTGQLCGLFSHFRILRKTRGCGLVVLVISGGSISVKKQLLPQLTDSSARFHPISILRPRSTDKRFLFLATQPWWDHCSFGSVTWTIIIRAFILQPRRCLDSLPLKTSCKGLKSDNRITSVVLGYWSVHSCEEPSFGACSLLVLQFLAADSLF